MTNSTACLSSLPRGCLRGAIFCACATMALPVVGAADAGRLANASPVTPTHAQFGGQCAEGMAEDAHVTTDCSVNWASEDGKVYCFSSDKARHTFLKHPARNLKRAQAFYAKEGMK